MTGSERPDAATRTKICGLTCEADLDVAVTAGADAVGLLTGVPVDSPREIDRERATALVAATPPFVTSVVVTMPESPAAAIDLAETVEPDAIQLHAGLTPEEVGMVTDQTAAQVVQAVDAESPEEARRYDDVADALLLDSVDESGAGGTGRTHDWERTRSVAVDLDSPVVLAGGLTPKNVGEAVRTVEPFAVDVASGVERDAAGEQGDEIAGRKDPDAVASFVTNATQATSRPTP